MPLPIARPHNINPSLDTARVVLAYKAFGCDVLSHVGLGVTAACTATALRRHGIWAEVWPVADGKALLERLRATEARAVDCGRHEVTHVVIHAPYMLTEDIALLARDFPNTIFAVQSHSNFGFLAADPHAVKLLRETADLAQSTHNVRVAGNSEKFTNIASDLWGVDVAYLPNIYELTSDPPVRAAWAGDALRLGLFGAGRILKNGLTGAAAAVYLAKKLRVPTELYVSTGAEEEGTNRSLLELTDGIPNLKLVRSGWLPWTKFRELVAHMHVLLQPSFTESFNVVTADGIAAGVPTVTSEAIDWVPSMWQANPDDAGEVARVAEYLLRSPHAIEDGRAALTAYGAAGVRHWSEYLGANGAG
jgi:hypothetical protein